MATQQEFESRIEALNRPQIQTDQNDAPKIGWDEIATSLAQVVLSLIKEEGKPIIFISFDGYVGTDWNHAIDEVKNLFHQQQISVKFFNIENSYKSDKELDEQFQPYLGDDPVFGRLYKKGMKTLFDENKLAALKKELRKIKRKKSGDSLQVVLCYGTGSGLSALRGYFDLLIYADLTRQEVLKRNKNWSDLAGKTQSISPKKLYYIDFQINDRHRNRLLSKINFYIDGNRADKPIMISSALLKKTTEAIATSPFRLKPFYEPGPWGGQWLKKIRDLPDEWVNCAWSYEVIAQEQSLLVEVERAIVEFPWTTFFYLEYDRVMGDVPKKRFGGEFPIRYDYLDTMGGGDLSIQVHPTTRYINKHFGEPYHQGEMYYIVAAREGTTVNLGLNEETDPDEFYQAAKLADEKAIPFNYHDFVNNVPSKVHDLILIPPGTVHGSGEGQVVLEISATTYRYTFKIYDHLRPDLNGVMRPIHVKHGFNVIKWFRRSKWVEKNLKQAPRLIRSGKGWREFLIGDRREFFHIVFRLEFEREIEDSTNGKFHVLTLVEGDSVLLQSIDHPEKQYKFNYSETIIVPACLGEYRIWNQGEGVCKIAKARLR